MRLWNRNKGRDKDDFPPGYAEWPALDRVNFNLERLTRRLTVTHNQQVRLKWTVRFLSGALVLMALMFGVGVWQFLELKETQQELGAAQEDIEDIILASCENGNASREVHNEFWSYLLDVSASSPGNQTPRIQRFFREFNHTVDQAFNQRPCEDVSDLRRKYPAPTFPDIPTPEELEEE